MCVTVLGLGGSSEFVLRLFCNWFNLTLISVLITPQVLYVQVL